MTEPFQRSRDGFAQQPYMHHLGAQLTHVDQGEVRIELPLTNHLTQQHGFMHAGALASVMDTACGFAALTTLPPERSVLTAEFKINLLRPARGRAAVVEGKVLKAGRTLVVVQAVAHMRTDLQGPLVQSEPCAHMIATIAAVEWTPDLGATSPPEPS